MRTKLTADQVEAIRSRYAAGGVSQQSLADEFGVSQRMVSFIVRGEAWLPKAPCKICGEPFEPQSPTHWYCSPECFVEGRRRRRHALWAAAHPKPPRFCPHCGHRLAPSKRADAVFCSVKCEEAAHNATRKATWKTGEPAEHVSRAYIIERDRARCHLCGKRCQKDEITLDHLIPLAQGGTHAADNLRVACLRCNTSKGARPANEQLLLLG